MAYLIQHTLLVNITPTLLTSEYCSRTG